MDFPPDAIIGAIGGCGTAAALARFFIVRALKDLDSIAKKISSINEKLIAVDVTIESLKKLEKVVSQHDRKIASIESRLTYERPFKYKAVDHSAD